MKAYMFPGQGSQFPGMAKELYENNPTAREMFDRANEILGFDITDIMFNGTAEDLKQTKVTQPAVFLHSVILALCSPDFKPDMVAGVISRAVTSLDNFMPWVRGKYTDGILYLKGGDLTEEIANARLPKASVKTWHISDWTDDPFFETKQVIFIRKV